jgi:hypothetical protein
VMPNHVHLLVLPLVPIPVLMRWLKGSTARGANRILRRTGRPFWQDESYDHYLRGAPDRTIAYIEGNPVSAGLVTSAELWPWSSAGWGWQAEPPAPQATDTSHSHSHSHSHRHRHKGKCKCKCKCKQQ